MKPIELNDEQKARLLEMCKSLFPKYIITIHQTNNVIVSSKVEKFYEVIHWFEFCFKILSSKIINDNDELNNFKCMNFNKIHPVDYLYEQFLKLK